MCMSVDLPEPDGPMIAVKVPRSNATSTPRSASTAELPAPKRFVSVWPRTTAAPAAASASVSRGRTMSGCTVMTPACSRARALASAERTDSANG